MSDNSLVPSVKLSNTESRFIMLLVKAFHSFIVTSGENESFPTAKGSLRKDRFL
jgi:hypothetical protein